MSFRKFEVRLNRVFNLDVSRVDLGLEDTDYGVDDQVWVKALPNKRENAIFQLPVIEKILNEGLSESQLTQEKV